ncbi:MAG: GT4 family glycosyltransferase PelF [Sulfurospirillaceae bacterium]|nr:GT4 family glycosyltransferase PelF [Sulfurospirillaceae bacterium]
MSRIKVVWTGEGTYPYSIGGVSTWADTLMHELKNIDFVLIPIQMHPYIKLKFDIPPNVVEIINVPLWGTEEPVEYIKQFEFSRIYASKIKTQMTNEIKTLEPVIILILDHIFRKKEDLDAMGDSLLQFYEYFQIYDYYETFRSVELWEIYKNYILNHYKDEKDDIPTVFDMIEGLRYLYRFFISMIPTLPEAQIYHSSAAAFCGLSCIIAKKKYGSKFLLTEHGVYIREQYLAASRNQMPYRTKEFLMGLITLVSKLNFHFADIVSPVCNYNARWEKRWGTDERKIHTIYNGIDTNVYRQFDVTKNEDRPTVVMVARIDPLKDIETFIKTAKLVAEVIPNVLFKLYGPVVDEKYFHFCQDLAKELNIEENFIFAGRTDSPQTAYNESDVVMLTSISEAFPFVVIEAMACEKVVISSDVGGTKEVLEGFGYVVKPKDYAEFADKVIYVLKNPDIARSMGMDARESILNGFTTEDIVDNYSKVYKNLYNEYMEEKEAEWKQVSTVTI